MIQTARGALPLPLPPPLETGGEVEIDDGLITESVRSKAVINLDGLLGSGHDKRRRERENSNQQRTVVCPSDGRTDPSAPSSRKREGRRIYQIPSLLFFFLSFLSNIHHVRRVAKKNIKNTTTRRSSITIR